jgi:hypothetical protein
MNIYFKVVEVQIQALEYIPKLGSVLLPLMNSQFMLWCRFIIGILTIPSLELEICGELFGRHGNRAIIFLHVDK